MSVRTVPRPDSIDRGICSVPTEYGMIWEIGGEASLEGDLLWSFLSKSSWSPCDIES